jgi:hypothetical protein
MWGSNYRLKGILRRPYCVFETYVLKNQTHRAPDIVPSITHSTLIKLNLSPITFIRASFPKAMNDPNRRANKGEIKADTTTDNV